MSEIETFIFFDLETTGFGAPIEITELAMVAVSRSALLQAGNRLPRVLGKLVVHANPTKAIEHKAAELTGKICVNWKWNIQKRVRSQHFSHTKSFAKEELLFPSPLFFRPLQYCHCINKKTKICVTEQIVYSIIGLSAQLLAESAPFEEQTIGLIRSFLGQFRTPINLVAHNGLIFDFPILRRQLVSDFYLFLRVTIPK